MQTMLRDERCYKCGFQGYMTTDEVRGDGGLNLRVVCGKCGGFISFKPKTETNLRERVFQLVRDLALAKPVEIRDLQSRAMALIREGGI